MVTAEVSGAAAPRRHASKRFGWLFWLSVAWIGLMLVLAVGAGWLPIPSPTKMSLFQRNQGLSALHWLGTDGLGRDLFARIVHGAQVSMLIGLAAPTLAVLVGGSLGVMAGYWRGHMGRLTMGAMDVLLTFPPIVLMLVLTAYLGPSLLNLTLVLAMLFVPVAARVARAVTLAVAQREFVTAARALGATDLRIMVREILPNVAIPMLSFYLFIVAVVIVLEGALSFLALGLPPPTPSWGVMISEGRNSLETAPHITFIPSMVLFLTVLAFNLVGDAFRAVAEPSRS